MSRDWNDDDDITANYHGGNPESAEAHEKVKESKAFLQRLVVDNITANEPDGYCCDEVEAITGRSHQSLSPRFTELKEQGVIVEIGKRATRTGCKAAVFGLADNHPPSDDEW